MGPRFLGVLAFAIFLAVPSPNAQTQRPYVQLETEDAFIYMDDTGVAIRVEKNWACKNIGWASTADPKILDKERFASFRDGQITYGTWNQWICAVIPGPVVYSRDVQKAQREMNASPKRPAQARHVPETGRYNSEMLDYVRIVLASEVQEARRTYEGQLIAAYRDFIPVEVSAARIQNDPDAVIVDLSAQGKALRLHLRDPVCGRVVATVHDAVTCRFAEREIRLRAVEDSYKAYADIVNALSGRSVITATEAQAVNIAARRVKRSLARLEAATLGLTGAELSSP